MTESRTDHDQIPSPAATREGDPAAQLMMADAARLRAPLLRRRAIGGYRRGDVDALLERAARIAEEAGSRVTELRAEADRLRAIVTTLDARLRDARPGESQEQIAEVFAAAQRTAAAIRDEAAAEAAGMVASAREQAEPILAEAGRLRAEARAEVEEARRRAASQLAEAQVQRRRLLEEASGEAAKVRDRLEDEIAGLRALIEQARQGWADLVEHALARLEEPAPSRPGELAAGPPTAEATPPPLPGSEGDPAGKDVIAELGSRLTGARDAAGEHPSPGLR